MDFSKANWFAITVDCLGINIGLVITVKTEYRQEIVFNLQRCQTGVYLSPLVNLLIIYHMKRWYRLRWKSESWREKLPII